MSAILKQKLIDIANGFTKYGLWKGGGSGGSSALSDMTDVTFANLQANDVLKYNGSVWVNDNLHEYSTEEKVVGKWIDGKPIYEKVIPFTSTLNQSTWIETPELINDKEQILQTFGISTTSYITLMGNIDRNDSVYVRVWNLRNMFFPITHVIMQYTKTTD